MAKMAIALNGAYFGPECSMTGVAGLLDLFVPDRLGETRPHAAGFVLNRAGKQRLFRHHVDIDAGLLVVKILARTQPLRSVLLRRLAQIVVAAAARAPEDIGPPHREG